MNIKTTLKSSVAAAALFAIAAPVAPSVNAADDTLKSGNKNSLTVSGYVARSLMYVDDGTSDALFLTDGSTSETRVRWVAKGTLNENVTAGAMIEYEVPHSNGQNRMTLNDNTTPGTDGVERDQEGDWSMRHTFVWVSHKKMGKISLGNTNAASNGRSETTFSGTNMVDLSGGNPFGQGIRFINTTTPGAPTVSAVTIGNAFTNLDGRSRDDVLRYDTPRFAGLALATSYIAGGDWDVGADYKAKFAGFRVRVQAQYNNSSATQTAGDTTTSTGTASASAGFLHDSGINAAIAYGERQLDGDGNAGRGDDPSFFYFNVGYRAKIFSVGPTNISFSWNHTSDLINNFTATTNNDTEGDAVGFSIAQIFKPIGANVVFSYRNYDFESSTATFDDIDVISLQTVFNF